MFDRIVVKPIQEDTKSKGGILIPDTSQKRPSKGEVVAAGIGNRHDDGTLVALDVVVGDVIIFAKSAGIDVKIDDEDFLIMKESDVMAVVIG